jgi:hypothetical protein
MHTRTTHPDPQRQFFVFQGTEEEEEDKKKVHIFMSLPKLHFSGTFASLVLVLALAANVVIRGTGSGCLE